MKKVILAVVTASLFIVGCKKAENKDYKNVELTYNIDNQALKFTTLVDENGKPKWIETEDNKKIIDYFKAHPECVTAIEKDGHIKMYKDQTAYTQSVFAPIFSRATVESCAGTNTTGSAIFRAYKHSQYNTMLATQTPNLYDAFNVYWPQSTFFTNNAYTTGDVYKTLGFKVPWVGSEQNDQFSSFKVNTHNGDFFQWYFPAGYGRFMMNFFEHANYGGKCLAFQDCRKIEESNLQYYMMTWIFASWNDKISSYHGFYY